MDLINLQISPTVAPLFRQVIEDRLEVIIQQIAPLKKQLDELAKEKEELEKQLSTINGRVHNAPMPSSTLNGYKTDTTVLEKIKYVLKKVSKPLTSREIAEEIIKCEPALGASKETRESTLKNVSTNLSIYQGNGKTFKRIEKDGYPNKFILN